MTQPRHRQQFDAARDPYGARNALGIITWVAVDQSAPHAHADQPFYGGGYQLAAGSGVSFSVTNNPKQVSISATGGAAGVASLNTLTGALTIAAGTGINVASAGTTITISAPLFGAAAQGEVPASGGGTANFLRADGSWGVPPGTGLTAAITTINPGANTGPTVTFAAGSGLALTNPSANNLQYAGTLFGTSAQGDVPASGGGTTNFLRADGTWAAPPAGGSPVAPTNIRVFTASGSWTPTAGTVVAIVECIGGGGGGAGTAATPAGYDFGGGGGGGGGYSKKLLKGAAVTTTSFTIGAAGSGGAAGGNDGGAGGATNFGASACVANGGSGGANPNTIGPAGGAGASVTGAVGDFTVAGAPGQNGLWSAASGTAYMPAGGGAPGPFGGGAQPVIRSSTGIVNGNAGTAYGSGGGGGFSYNGGTASAGGNGFAGVLIITEFG